MIYVHVPFCHRKCTYCAFYSRAGMTPGTVSAYVDALLDEMAQRHDEQAHPIQTVYFGGGTPSLLPIAQLGRIVDDLRRWFDLSQVREATIEANPEDLTPDYLQAIAALRFFNRISIGVQSLDDNVLRLLNRRHTARQAIEAVANARAAGFDNISIDFIYGITAGAETTDRSGILEAVTHVSAYSLTVEPGTALAVQVGQGSVALPDDEEVVRQYHAMHDALADRGFVQYEVSNYARPGYRSQHNSRYWSRTPYLGFGPGAHSFDGHSRRWNNPDGTVGGETLAPADALNELLMTALRTTDGLAAADLPAEHKERLHRGMQPYIDCGWIAFESNRYRPTVEGLLHADGMAAALFL